MLPGKQKPSSENSLPVTQQQWRYRGSYTTIRTGMCLTCNNKSQSCQQPFRLYLLPSAGKYASEVFWYWGIFFLVPPYFCPLFHYFFIFFPPFLSLACFFLPALTLLHLNFFPMSKPHVFFQHFPFLLKLGLTGHITVTLLPVTVCNCICWFRKSFLALYFFLVSCSFDKTWSFWWRFMFRY